MLYSLKLSFYDWNGFGTKTFVGLQNYKILFTRDPLFLKSLGNSGLIGLSIILAANVAASDGRPSLFINPPGILPTDGILHTNYGTFGTWSCLPSF